MGKDWSIQQGDRLAISNVRKVDSRIWIWMDKIQHRHNKTSWSETILDCI